MKRKIIKLATNTLVVSLPSKWAKQHGIKKGDEVHVQESPHALIVSSEQAAKRKFALKLGDNPDFAARQINIAYKRGFDEVEVQYENPKAYSKMVQELSSLIGFELVHSGKRTATVKNIAGSELENFDAVLRRAFLSVLEIAEATEAYAKTHSEEALDQVNAGEDNVDKLTDFCKRLLNKHGATDIAQTTLLYGLLKDLERIADQYVEITRVTFPKNFLPALADTHKLLRALYELFYDYDTKKSEETLEKLKHLKNHSQILLKERHAAAAHHIATIAGMLNEMSWTIYARSF